ncbi:hypothetical protein [Alienimonas chondri]|uniref:Uncharacterized protein n=1 Tax=Alienimonas chondri TaxID=2681879 RepID=A0ABX1VF42_9PLAN|nr:hypothetical protein [Alienimonas chondri]NNJ26512.1 hypothetical protein [Alienimonas chondri]
MSYLTPAASGTPPPAKSEIPTGFDALALLRPPLPRPTPSESHSERGAEFGDMAENALLFTLVTAILVPGLVAFTALLIWFWYW